MAFQRSEKSKASAHQERAYTKPGDVTIEFEDQPTRPGCRFQDAYTLLYGRPGIGKTTLASHLPGAYFLATEQGYKFLMSRKTHIDCWNKFTAFIEWAEKHPKKIADVQIWVIDTATLLAKYAMYGSCADLGITHPSDSNYGKGWEAYYDNLFGWIARLAGLGRGIMFICHERIRDITVRAMQAEHYGPDLPQKPYRVIMDMCDIALHMAYVEDDEDETKRGRMRCLYSQPTEYRDAKDKTNSLPAELPFLTEKQAVKKIMAAYAKQEGE